MFIPELLAPAGDMERLDAALLYGADAIYLGGKNALNLRAGAIGFSWEELELAVQKVKQYKAKIYYCLNIFAGQESLKEAEYSLECLQEYKIDGLIIADPGLLRLAKLIVPKIPIHLSTQANTCNLEAVRFWYEQGVSRVNLARELDITTLSIITKKIQAEIPGMELEIFVQGAMCLAVSGQCLMSAWLNNRSGNLGKCTHPCRFEYRPMYVGFEESLRQGQALWELASCNNSSKNIALDCSQYSTNNYEHDFSLFSESYASIWSPEDLCLIKYLKWFAVNKVSAIKLEGRMRSSGATAQIVNLYKSALLDLTGETEKSFRPVQYLQELANIATRPFGTGFFLPRGKRKTFLTKNELNMRTGNNKVLTTTDQTLFSSNKIIVAKIQERIGDTKIKVIVKAPWDQNSHAEIILPQLKFCHLQLGEYSLENHKGEKVSVLHPGMSGAVHGCFGEGVGSGMFIRSCF